MSTPSTNSPRLILIRGLPGSGKTYITEALAAVLKEAAGIEQPVILDPDTTDYQSEAYHIMCKELSKQGVDEKFFPYRFLRFQAWRGIEENNVIIWNQPFTNTDGLLKTIVNLQTYAKDHNRELPMLIVEVEIDPALAKQRVESRKQAGGHGPSLGTFDRYINDFESFKGKDSYNVITVSGSDSQAAVTAIVEAFTKLSSM